MSEVSEKMRKSYEKNIQWEISSLLKILMKRSMAKDCYIC